VVLLGAISAAAVFVAAIGWLSPSEGAARFVARGAPTSGGGTTAAATIQPAPTTSPTIPSTTVAPVGQRTLSVLMTGDILAETPVLVAGRKAGKASGQRYDFSAVFAPITPLVRSFDLAICHMEQPIGRPSELPGAKGRSRFGGNRLLAPYELAAAVESAGFDRCSTASNHSYDLGDAGVDSTIDALQRAGLSWSGTARQPGEAAPTTFEWHGVRIAHLAYTRYSNAGAARDTWRDNLTSDPARIAAEVTAVRNAGAELVIVSIHLIGEMTKQPIAANRAFAAAVTASADIDALVQHGPHVVQGFEVLNGTPVWWSVGNLLTGMARPGETGRYADPRSRDGLGAVMRFHEDGPGNWRLDTSSLVLCDERSSRTIYAGVSASQDPTLPPALRKQLQGCVDRTRRAVPDAG
jgi:poly-gamma-glutamate synthesis protein (capsule biosynthesis protein)